MKSLRITSMSSNFSNYGQELVSLINHIGEFSDFKNAEITIRSISEQPYELNPSNLNMVTIRVVLGVTIKKEYNLYNWVFHRAKDWSLTHSCFQRV